MLPRDPNGNGIGKTHDRAWTGPHGTAVLGGNETHSRGYPTVRFGSKNAFFA